MLKVGMRGTDVSRLQNKLKSAGFNPGSADGVFGPKTRAAVIAYQRSKKLSADGVVGPSTGEKLFGSRNTKYWDGKSDFSTPPSTAPVPGGSNTGSTILDAAADVAKERRRYVWGGGHKARPGASTGIRNPKTVADDVHTKGYDCSGFVREAVYRATGKDLMNGTAATQYRKCKSILRADLKPGDLIFWGRPITHVAIYAGKSNGVHMMYESAPSYERKGSSYGTHLTPMSYQGTPSHYGRVR